ncbi:MAG: hypothetical protein V4489_05340 [Chlamydiota bacterium]
MAKKYKTHTSSLKAKVALEAVGNQKTTNQIASGFTVSPSQVSEWKQQLLDEIENFFQTKRRRKAIEPHEDVEYLQQQIGKLTTQVEWLKKKQMNGPLRNEKNG